MGATATITAKSSRKMRSVGLRLSLTAESITFMGAVGHLATITSEAEQLFLEDLYDGEKTWIGLTDDPAFGGMESEGQPNPQVDGWVWVTGEEVTFTNWFAAGVPNNQNGSEHYVTMGEGIKRGGWNDDVGHLRSVPDRIRSSTYPSILHGRCPSCRFNTG